eukprot:scaffold179_cov368-Prasinococcus_capsulatus_cf.AAC.16
MLQRRVRARPYPAVCWRLPHDDDGSSQRGVLMPQTALAAVEEELRAHMEAQKRLHEQLEAQEIQTMRLLQKVDGSGCAGTPQAHKGSRRCAREGAAAEEEPEEQASPPAQRPVKQASSELLLARNARAALVVDHCYRFNYVMPRFCASLDVDFCLFSSLFVHPWSSSPGCAAHQISSPIGHGGRPIAQPTHRSGRASLAQHS